jgi:two-component system sensor histidine kinase YesM
VENAIYHGLKGLDHRGTIRIRIHRSQGSLHIEVADDGRGMSDETLQMLNASLENRDAGAEAHGVMNVHRRIQLLCGEEYGLLCAKNEQGEGSAIRIRLPVMLPDAKGG